MNLSKLIVPVVTGLALITAVVGAQAQTSGTDVNSTTTTTTNDSGTGTTTLDTTTTTTTTDTSTGRVVATEPAMQKDAAGDDQLVARTDRN